MKKSVAFERGAARGRYLRRLERRNIYGAAVNPYKTTAKADAWQRGFVSTYYGESAA